MFVSWAKTDSHKKKIIENDLLFYQFYVHYVHQGKNITELLINISSPNLISISYFLQLTNLQWLLDNTEILQLGW